ncbi:MAG: DNA-processing protein DprA [Bacteroidales bacterium]|nr:DNA-processing protein DprA [Bacteroidales bacterium]MBR5670308.1 DNA-processing protein DprA [Bacteroidales bacterium]
MNETLYLAALNKMMTGDWKMAHSLITYFGSASAVFKAAPKELKKLLPDIDPAAFLSGEVIEDAAKELEYCRREGIEVLTIEDEAYPSRLAETTDAPLVIFKRGSRKLNGARFLAIVGTRHCTPYAKKYCEMIAEYMSSLKVKPVIVSGMAYGVDTMAHQAALRYGLDTIAVTATGLDTVYPVSNRNLAPRIEERGAVVTEYWSGTPAYPYNFLSRNRIIAGLSDATVVVESRIHGGSLVTAKAAFNYNREVFTFPGKLEDECYAGCNLLIAENMAQLARSAQHISDALGWYQEAGAEQIRSRQARYETLSPEKKEILKALRQCGEMDAARIAAYCSYDISETSLLLLEMEIEDLVKHISTNKYVYL